MQSANRPGWMLLAQVRSSALKNMKKIIIIFILIIASAASAERYKPMRAPSMQSVSIPPLKKVDPIPSISSIKLLWEPAGGVYWMSNLSYLNGLDTIEQLKILSNLSKRSGLKFRPADQFDIARLKIYIKNGFNIFKLGLFEPAATTASLRTHKWSWVAQYVVRDFTRHSWDVFGMVHILYRDNEDTEIEESNMLKFMVNQPFHWYSPTQLSEASMWVIIEP